MVGEGGEFRSEVGGDGRAGFDEAQAERHHGRVGRGEGAAQVIGGYGAEAVEGGEGVGTGQ